MTEPGAAKDNLLSEESLAALPCYLLYVGWRKAQALYRPMLQGQNPQRLYIFQLLCENDTMGVTKIAQSLELEVAGASSLLSRMEKEGFVKRERNERNYLEKLCSLTPLGHKTYAELSKRIEAVDRQLLDRLDSSDLPALENIVRQIKALGSDLLE